MESRREENGGTSLREHLSEYLKKHPYPMHMPGHKRRIAAVDGLPIGMDFTEVPGTDDLHHPESILKEAMERTAKTCGADHTWYLVNGSTAGNLCAVFALAPYHGELIVARNCHRSVYHALELRDVFPHFIDPEVDPEYEIPAGISPEKVEEALVRYPNSTGVILTSPTYEGVVSDIRKIAEICHRHHALLFVDEAHGAHFGLVPEAGFPESAIQRGADLVVQSAHKTFLGLTQTAFLHSKGAGVDPEEVQRALDMFETSSPSYPLMLSLDSCTDWLLREGKAAFRRWHDTLEKMDENFRKLRCFRVLCHGKELCEEASCKNEADAWGKKAERSIDARRKACERHGFYDYDPSKILILTKGTPYSGDELTEVMSERFHFVLEMSLSQHALAMTGPGDDPEELLRFSEALLTLDQELQDRNPESDPSGQSSEREGMKWCPVSDAEQVMTLQEAANRPYEMVDWDRASGRISKEMVYCYPPGVPMIVPGERIGKGQLEVLRKRRAEGKELRFTVSSGNDDTIACIREV